MPDKWEYPWYAAWDLAFHMIPFARIDPGFAKSQLVLFLREWYMHPNGQLPAYEFNFGDVNPPVHAWSCWRVYKMTAARGQRDRVFLSRCFQKLVINFTWWVNRKDLEGRNLFAGGFLGLDNIGVFDRSKPLPTGGHLQQADGTAWMAFYCATMLSIALELARDNPATEDMASKFFEHFVAIADAMNTQGGTGLWDEEDGFYYDQLRVGGRTIPAQSPLAGRPDPAAGGRGPGRRTHPGPARLQEADGLVPGKPARAEPSSSPIAASWRRARAAATACWPSRRRAQLERVLRYVLDENEFLSPYGIRSLSRVHQDQPYIFRAQRRGTSRGLRARRVRHAASSAATPTGAAPSGSRSTTCSSRRWNATITFTATACWWNARPAPGKRLNLQQVADELRCRLARLFLRDAQRPPALSRRGPPFCRRPALARPRCCSTNTSTARPAAASAPATRRAGPPS